MAVCGLRLAAHCFGIAPELLDDARGSGGVVPAIMKRMMIALLGAAVIYYSTSGGSLAQQLPSDATVSALYQFYKPRLSSLTPRQIEMIWSDLSQSQPWFRHAYGILSEGNV
jgi:hypothetical protein